MAALAVRLLRVRMMPVVNGVVGVLLLRAPADVLDAVVGLVTVEMPHDGTAVERKRNERVH
nr:hypothetical protein [Microbacterium agarici]